MSDTFERVKGIIVDLLDVDPAKVTLDPRFREELEAEFTRPGRINHGFRRQVWR